MASRRGTRSVVRALALGAAGVLSVGAAPAAGARAGAEARGRAGPALAWRRCGEGFECSTLTVPTDTGDGGGGHEVRLKVVRQPARHARERIGSLVVNPGGPGEPAVDYLRAEARAFPAAVQDHFDLVAFDPRGVGNSMPVDCESTLDPLFDQAFSPSTLAERDALEAQFEHLAASCASRNAGFLAHVSTQDAARDLERLRIALGDDSLSFVGFSYATYLGTVYASTYPKHVRAFVLDGAIDPMLDASASVLAQARGFERALDDFLADCSKRPSCAFHHRAHAARAYDQLRARAARVPLAVADDPSRPLNETRFDAAVLQELYGGRAEWSTLAAALTDADRGDASTLLAIADAYVGRDSSGRDDDELEAFWAISCLDGPDLPNLEAARRVEAEAVRVAPRLGAFVVNNGLACSVWPVPPVPAPPRLTASGAPPLLVIGTTRDPATPLAQSRALVDELDSAVLLVVQGERHTAFLSGNRCVDRIVSRYLVSLDVPADGARC
jgi:pimeloyl-ACP methyl ester carboxylesterase